MGVNPAVLFSTIHFRRATCENKIFKKMLKFSKGSFIVILQFFLLIIMAVWSFKQTIMKDYNIQSCQWMRCDRFRQPFLLCSTFRSTTLFILLNFFVLNFSFYSFRFTTFFVFSLHIFSLATYSLVINNVFFVISS